MKLTRQTPLFYVFLLVSIGAFLVRCSSSTSLSEKKNLTPEELEKAKQDFGELLFNDVRLSLDESISCASCHDENRAFTDGKATSIGIKGRSAFRNSPSLFNVKDAPYFMHDGAVKTLEMQAIVPIQDTNEMGFTMKLLIERLQKDPEYSKLAKDLFNRELDAFVITRSLASFQKSLISVDSKFDEYKKSGYKKGFTASEQRGWVLFSETFGCIECHALPHFTNYTITKNYSVTTTSDFGRFRITGKEEDKWKFKTPSLRNIDLTAPYMHDGSLKTLEEVLLRYSNVTDSIPVKRMKKFTAKKEDMRDLNAFLKTLTDNRYIIIDE